MSELRADPRPSMVSPYGQTLPSIHIAETWRPEGTQGEVMVIVPERFEIAENMKDGINRIEFPVGTYLIPVAIRRAIRRLNPDGEWVEQESVVRIGGPKIYDQSNMPVIADRLLPHDWSRVRVTAEPDEQNMHWKLKASKVRYASNQPHLHHSPPAAVVTAPSPEITAPRLAERFCPYCGHPSGQPHDPACHRYRPTLEAADGFVAAPAAPALERRRRGRPPGSKNKQKEEELVGSGPDLSNSIPDP